MHDCVDSWRRASFPLQPGWSGSWQWSITDSGQCVRRRVAFCTRWTTRSVVHSVSGSRRRAFHEPDAAFIDRRSRPVQGCTARRLCRRRCAFSVSHFVASCWTWFCRRWVATSQSSCCADVSWTVIFCLLSRVGAAVLTGSHVTVAGCVSDVRLSRAWLPMDRSENDDSDAAHVSRRSQNVDDGCESNACVGILCQPGLICVDVWRHPDCRLATFSVCWVFCSQATPRFIKLYSHWLRQLWCSKRVWEYKLGGTDGELLFAVLSGLASCRFGVWSWFLDEHDYVTFALWYEPSVCRLSSVLCSVVALCREGWNSW